MGETIHCSMFYPPGRTDPVLPAPDFSRRKHGLREVFAHSDQRGSRVEIVTTLSARLENDVALSMNFVGDSQRFREDFQVHCAEADLIYRDGAVFIARHSKVERLVDLEPESNPNAAFIDLLSGVAENFAPASVALPVWDFTQAVLESAHTDRLVRLGEPGA